MPVSIELFGEQVILFITDLVFHYSPYLTINNIIKSIGFILLTLFIYQLLARTQKKLGYVWFNPMLLSIVCIIPILLYFNFTFEHYFIATQPLHSLLEPAVVALGFPIYQHLTTIKNQWRIILALLTLGAALVITISFMLTMVFIALPEIAVSLSLKSITTPIGIALTEELNGNNAITAFAIIVAGLSGAILGPRWLKFIGVKSAKAQGLAMGSASHAFGTFTISKVSFEHGAYASLALIISAMITAIVSPFLITQLARLFL